MSYEFANVYGFRPKLRPVSIMRAGGRSLTIPHQAIDIGKSVLRYSAPSIQEKLKGYYEEEGLELPNFDRLDKVERLQMLADAKASMFHAKEKAENAVADYEAKAKAAKEAAENNPIPSQSNTDQK